MCIACRMWQRVRGSTEGVYNLWKFLSNGMWQSASEKLCAVSDRMLLQERTSVWELCYVAHFEMCEVWRLSSGRGDDRGGYRRNDHDNHDDNNHRYLHLNEPTSLSPYPELPPVTTIIAQVLETRGHPEQDFDLLSPKPVTSECPATTFDVGGRGCNSDMDCPIEQRCCRPMIVSLGVNPQRCVCPDKHAVWSSCGTLCPEYCGQPSVPVCSGTCSAGCHCAPGFVKARNDVTAPCVPRESCSSTLGTTTPTRPRISPVAASMDDPGVRFATIREIMPQDPYSEDVVSCTFESNKRSSHCR